jgi:hypothetical protein
MPKNPLLTARARTVTGCIAASLMLTLGACSTIPADECAHVDWHLLGIQDGRDGYPHSRIQRHADACSKAGVIPDTARWEAGRNIGLEDFCRLPNAVEHGLARKSYAGVCANGRFARLHDAARALADARHEIESVDRELERRERQFASNRRLDDRERARLWGEIRSLERRRDRLTEDRREAAAQLDYLVHEYGI